MDPNPPRRRGRPTSNPTIAAAAPVAAQAETPAADAATDTAKPTQRRRRASVGGHALKLSAPARPGFQRRWFNDDKNRIADAGELAYDHVSEGGAQASGTDTRISRLVGTKASGEPLRAYLMETPIELYAEGASEREAQNRLVDEAIVAGRDSTGQMPSTETYGQGSIQRDR